MEKRKWHKQESVGRISVRNSIGVYMYVSFTGLSPSFRDMQAAPMRGNRHEISTNV